MPGLQPTSATHPSPSSFVDASRQWFKPRSVWASARPRARSPSVPKQSSSPSWACLSSRTRQRNARFAANPLVTGEPRIRFYAGAPLETPQCAPARHLVASLISATTRGPDVQQGQTLQALARQVITQLEHRAPWCGLPLSRPGCRSERRFRAIADTMPQIVWSNRPDGFHDYFHRPAGTSSRAQHRKQS